MQPGPALAAARRRAKLTQRELSDRAGVPQSAIARLESGRVEPRVDTLTHLLHACGWDLEVARRHGDGVDRTAIRALLRLTPRQRVVAAADDAAGLAALDAAVGR